MSILGCPQVNKFELVSSVGHQMSVTVREAPRSDVWGDAYHITYPMMHLMLLTHPVDRQTPVKTLPSDNFAGGNEPLCRR